MGLMRADVIIPALSFCFQERNALFDALVQLGGDPRYSFVSCVNFLSEFRNVQKLLASRSINRRLALAHV
jgi:hypothetical protein